METKEVNFDKIKVRAIYSKSLNLEENWRINIQLQNPLKRHYILSISLSIIEPYGTTYSEKRSVDLCSENKNLSLLYTPHAIGEYKFNLSLSAEEVKQDVIIAGGFLVNPPIWAQKINETLSTLDKKVDNISKMEKNLFILSEYLNSLDKKISEIENSIRLYSILTAILGAIILIMLFLRVFHSSTKRIDETEKYHRSSSSIKNIWKKVWKEISIKWKRTMKKICIIGIPLFLWVLLGVLLVVPLCACLFEYLYSIGVFSLIHQSNGYVPQEKIKSAQKELKNKELNATADLLLDIIKAINMIPWYTVGGFFGALGVFEGAFKLYKFLKAHAS